MRSGSNAILWASGDLHSHREFIWTYLVNLKYLPKLWKSSQLKYSLFLSTDCPDGTYGLNCTDTCGQCRDSVPCNKTDGFCPSGCQLWWTGDRCQAQIGKWEKYAILERSLLYLQGKRKQKKLEDLHSCVQLKQYLCNSSIKSSRSSSSSSS